MLRKLLLVLVAAVAAGLFWLFTTPAPFESVGWNPEPAPEMVGPLAPNEELRKATLLGLGKIHGPEDVAVDAQGRIYSGLADGRIVRITGEKVEVLVNTGGRPLGMAFDASGNLIVCDAWKGLLQVSPEGRISVLTAGTDGLPFAFTDDLDIAKDGKIYFTDASSKWRQPDYLMDYFEGRPYGRLLVYDPATRQTKTLLKDMYFPNGVALSQQEDAVFVAETYRNRVGRYWLRGPKAGQYEIVADNLPGMPDNINSDRAGTIWIALPSTRKAIADLGNRQPWIKDLVVKLPRSLWPKPDRVGFALAIDENGKILKTLQDPGGEHLRMITSVLPANGKLYFGSLENDRIGML